MGPASWQNLFTSRGGMPRALLFFQLTKRVGTMGGSRLTVQDGALLGAGMMCVSGAALAFRKKRTTAFKVAYLLSWPVLGTAIIKVWSPDRGEMQKVRQLAAPPRFACCPASTAPCSPALPHPATPCPLAGAV